MLTIRGIHNYTPRDLETAFQFLAGLGRSFPMAKLIGKKFRLTNAAEAFGHAHAHPGRHVAVLP